MKHHVVMLIALPLLAGLLACSTPLTTREKGAGIGTLGGAAAGGAIGGVLGLGTGARLAISSKASKWSSIGSNGKSMKIKPSWNASDKR